MRFINLLLRKKIRVRVPSIGTMTNGATMLGSATLARGTWQWRESLFSLVISAQESSVNYMLTQLLGSDYVCLDEKSTPEQSIGIKKLDKISVAATNTLKDRENHTFQRSIGGANFQVFRKQIVKKPVFFIADQIRIRRKPMLNLSPLFNNSNEDRPALLDALTLNAYQKEVLERARKEIRDCLKVGLPRVLRARGYESDVPTPRFFTQGSWSYKTLNAPAQVPQQCDLDDGAYLPLSFVTQTKRPSRAATLFFSAAEEALAPLVKMRGWKLFEKPTCIRVEVSSKAHVDIPLYAIPDAEFEMLKARAAYTMDSIEEAVVRAERDAWTELPSDQVLLAHRVKDWVESDPRPLKDWFLNEVDAKGEQLRRVVRYLKAYRDWRWSEGGPTSILLMAASVPLFEAKHGRDDLALLEMCKALPRTLRAGVDNPIEKSESLTTKLGPEGVEEAAQAFWKFASILDAAINCSDASLACRWLQEQFGERFPYSPHWVPTPSARDAVLATAAIQGPSEILGRNKSA